MRNFSFIPRENRIEKIAIGKFESMHLAHLAIFEKLGENDIILIIKFPDKLSILPFNLREKFAPREIFYIDFSEIKNLSGEEFLDFLKQKLPSLKTIVVGADFRFGEGRKCGISDIKKRFNVIALGEQRINGIPIHSSYIRDFIVFGEVSLANELLGRFYSIIGHKIRGQGLGAKNIFPTINISVSDFILPKNGVYASFTKIETEIFESISFIGHRLSTDEKFSIETHILNEKISENIDEVEIFFVEFIRENKRFNDLASLKNQIKNDIKIARDKLKGAKWIKPTMFSSAK